MTLRLYSFSFKAMACQNELQLFASSAQAANAAARSVAAAVHRLERRYSRYRPDSLLSKINQSAGEIDGVKVDDETAALLDYSAACYEQSGGLFDITSGALRHVWDFKAGTLPTEQQVRDVLELIGWDKVHWAKPYVALPIRGMELDLGGVVKEYAADTGANVCRLHRIRHGLVNMGGDIHVIGPHPDGMPWKIGIRHPADPNEIAASVNLDGGGLASSGDYRRFIEVDGQRYGHILDPRTGWPVRGLRAVTVIAPQCLVAGSTSTIAMLKGVRGGEWLAETGLAHLWFDNAEATCTPLGVGTSLAGADAHQSFERIFELNERQS